MGSTSVVDEAGDGAFERPWLAGGSMRGAAGSSTETGVTAHAGAAAPATEPFLEEFHLCRRQDFGDRSSKRFSPGVQLLAHVTTNLTGLLALRSEQCLKAFGLFPAKVKRGSQSTQHPVWSTPFMPNVWSPRRSPRWSSTDRLKSS